MRPARATDADALAAIHRAAFPPAEAWAAPEIAVQLGLPGGFGLIESDHGMILARVLADEAEVLTLAVVPAYRRHGLAAALLSAVLREARQRGAHAALLEVAANNQSARALYAAAGFVEVGRRRHYYADHSDALVLRLALSPCAATTC